MQLVGRDTQLATIDGAVEQVRGGASRVVIVSGEPGIGKTALLQAASQRARAAGLRTLEGRAAEHEREVPFALAVAALDDHVSTLRAPLDPALAAVLPALGGGHVPNASAAAERFRYHRALRGLIELLASDRPVALMLDDLHWADDASVEFVQHLLRRPPRAPHLLVLALRTEHSPGPVLQAAPPHPHIAHLQLQPLDHAQSLAVLAGVADARTREQIARDAGGVPLFLDQLARLATAPAGELPPCLLAAVGVEVKRLSDEARTLLHGAAVAGDPFDPELAAVAAELPVGGVAVPLDALVAADLVRFTGDGRGFAFRHPLVRRTVYDAAPPAWALGAHERIAAVLAARGAGASVRAHHVERFARPGDEHAIALLSEAAGAAGETAPASAARWYEAALRLVPERDPRRLELSAAQALALAGAGRVPEARDALATVLEALPDPPLELVAACAAMEKLLGRPADARRRLRRAYDAAPAPALALQLASVETCFGSGADIRAWAARAVDPDAPALTAAAEAAGALGALHDHDPVSAHAARKRAAALLRELDDAELAAQPDAFVHLVMAELATERFADAAETAARGLAFARRTGQARLLCSLSVAAALAQYERLELDQAVRSTEDAVDGARLQDVAHLQILVLRARMPVHEARGEFPEALEAAEEFAALLGQAPESYVTLTGRAIAATLDVERDPERCLRALRPLLEGADVTLLPRLLLTGVRAAIAVDRLDEAERFAARCSEHAAAMQLPAGLVSAGCARAEVLLARGDGARAAAVALGAVAAAERIGARRDEVSARLLAGRALAAAGDAEQAKAMLRQAADDARRGGAQAFVAEATRELRRLGTRIPSPVTESELTERERDVSDLVIQGRSNKQIAAELYLSEKTIESTLTRVYAKLGVRSRVELVRRMAPV